MPTTTVPIARPVSSQVLYMDNALATADVGIAADETTCPTAYSWELARDDRRYLERIRNGALVGAGR
ncbi:MAG: hypothetical protein LQ341_007554 [Variospora aurantia]|nr:MAG: hypothetical protein LQ341_007554 [Variospora aurantia]